MSGMSFIMRGGGKPGRAMRILDSNKNIFKSLKLWVEMAKTRLIFDCLKTRLFPNFLGFFDNESFQACGVKAWVGS